MADKSEPEMISYKIINDIKLQMKKDWCWNLSKTRRPISKISSERKCKSRIKRFFCWRQKTLIVWNEPKVNGLPLKMEDLSCKKQYKK